ncbi:MAG: hypothetical protein KDK38_10995 [Leptospiraceae bacterium]|nr:hypothetical protein [Leptospiraceae bacterium]
MISKTAFYLPVLFICSLLLSSAHDVSAIASKENSKLADGSLGVLIDPAALVRSIKFPQNLTDFDSGAYRTSSSYENLAYLGFSFNFFPFQYVGLDFSYLLGRLDVRFINAGQCVNRVSIGACAEAGEKSLGYADLHNLMTGLSVRIPVGYSSLIILPDFVRISSGYLFYGVLYNKEMTSGITMLQQDQIQDTVYHGVYLNLEFDYFFSHDLPSAFVSFGVGIRYIPMRLAGQTNNLHEWVYSLPIKFGIVF